MKFDAWYTEPQTENLSLSTKIKDILYVGKSEYQEIQVIDTYEYGKTLILENTYQTTERDEFIYHELISHPALFTHGNPKNVLVIGGGDGGTVREVLKHETVESVDFVELDGMVIEACKKYMPTLSCKIDDEKVNVIVTDGIKYVADVAKTAKRYDVIIVDCPDPVGPAAGLFEMEFYNNLYKCLTDDGVMVQQTESPLLHETLISKIKGHLKDAGFGFIRPMVCSIPTYPSGFWSFTLASKQNSPLETNPDEIVAKMEKYGMETKYYDEEVHKGVFLATPKYLK
ncbi:polyamine aminopropyltransferase [Methanococcus voltae]|uniref:Polyamine aminopropyltransferase n=1 Tax=Methanococcus voltae TaxID=2188 RepID=A0A8J7UTZ8_METVO|nr:polyamine aminopropyltransferase [Methanococcus voltae]MBP2172223.1 spermidine synthase [Methanococcus voltae]MBP2200821.1 spermidine synthase [Methanococcus voltae]